MKPIDVTPDSYANYNEDSNVTKPKFKIGDNVRILKHKNIFTKGYSKNWSEEVFVASKIKETVPWTNTISDLSGGKLMELFMKRNCKKQIIKNTE